jgi:hypothetical protein
MKPALRAGLVYFAVVFAAGFLLGTLRVLALVPRVGEELAVVIELPFMLLVSWIACKRLVTRFSVPGGVAARATMGASAFGLLMLAELGVSVLGFGRSIAESFESYQTSSALIGLLGQVAFAAFPIVQSRIFVRGTDDE